MRYPQTTVKTLFKGDPKNRLTIVAYMVSDGSLVCDDAEAAAEMSSIFSSGIIMQYSLLKVMQYSE